MRFTLNPPRTISRENSLYLRATVTTSRKKGGVTVYTIIYHIELEQTVEGKSRLVTIHTFPEDGIHLSFGAMEDAVEKRLADLRKEDWNELLWRHPR